MLCSDCDSSSRQDRQPEVDAASDGHDYINPLTGIRPPPQEALRTRLCDRDRQAQTYTTCRSMTPGVVYGPWPYPSDHWPFYWYPPGYVGSGWVGVEPGFLSGAAIWAGVNWWNRHVHVDHHRYNQFNRTNINNPELAAQRRSPPWRALWQRERRQTIWRPGKGQGARCGPPENCPGYGRYGRHGHKGAMRKGQRRYTGHIPWRGVPGGMAGMSMGGLGGRGGMRAWAAGA